MSSPLHARFPRLIPVPAIVLGAACSLYVVTTAPAAPAPAASSPEATYRLQHSIHVGGEGGWDAVTVQSTPHRLFLTHGVRVDVLDLGTDSLIGAIPDTPGVHGVALAPELNRGFTSNGRDSSVSIFDLKTLGVLGRVKLPARNPDAITYDATSGRVFAFNGGSASVTAIDARTGQIAGTLALGGKPEFAVSDGTGRIFVNLEDSSAVVAFDGRKLETLHRWPVGPGREPSGLAIDLQHHRLFSGCANQKLVVLDAAKGTVVASLAIGAGVDGVAFDPARQLVFSSNGDGTLTVIHEDGPDKYTVVENVTTKKGGRTLALDEASGEVYIPTAQLGPPPAPSAEHPHPRPSIVPGTFEVMVVGK